MEKVLFDNNVIDILHFNFFMTEVCKKNVSIIKTMLGFFIYTFCVRYSTYRWYWRGRIMEKDGIESTQSNESDKQKSKKNARTKYKCPFPSCSAEVIHLPRHMRQRYQWETKNASKVLSAFGLRKRHSTACSTKQPGKSRICPVYGCSSVVRRIHNHLTDFHHLKRGTEIYREALQSKLPHEVALLPSKSTPGSSFSEDESYRPKKKVCTEKKEYL